MKLQVFRRTTLTSSFSMGSQDRTRLAISSLACILLLAFCQPSLAQENFLVATQDGTFTVLDLNSYSILKEFKSGPLTYTVTSGRNNRLAYTAGGSGYGLATDTSIGHDITRLSGVRAPASTIGGAGKYYLAADYNFVLDVVDTATLQVVQRVDFSSVIPRIGNPGAIVAANNQAYIFPRAQNPQNPKAAVIALSNFQLSSIQLPAGSFCRRCASRLPDGSFVVAVERENSDGKTHVLLIDTTTNQVTADFAQTKNYGVQSVIVTPNPGGPLYGYVFSGSDGTALALDLQPNSPTYGHILGATAVTIPNLQVNEMALSSDGSRLIVAGALLVQQPAPNVDVVDTAKMLSDPAHALIAQLTVNNGIVAGTVCTGFFVTTPPGSAPTVSGVSGDITNDKGNDIAITGTNFQPGALVGVGSLSFFDTTFVDSTTLSVHIPKNMPAGKAQDIVVTNPLTNSPPDQQNQSGLLAGKFNILPNPSFLPKTEFATGNQASIQLYDLAQLSMVNLPTDSPGDIPYSTAINVDGKELYTVKLGYDGFFVVPTDLKTRSAANPIPLPSTAQVAYGQVFAASRDPQTDGPVIYTVWTDATDLHISKIDSDPNSPTFNTIVHTFTASLNGGNFAAPPIMTVGPDGKYAYVWYGSNISYLGIFNLTTGAFTNVGYDRLRVQEFQSQIYVAPDGKSLLLSSFHGNRTHIRVFDISNPTSPKSLLELTPIPIPRRGAPYVNNYQVLGNKLYAIDLTGAVVVFNFDRTKGDFRERGWVASESTENFSAFGFSADGVYLYLSDYFSDLVFVADTNKLALGGDPTVTNIRSPYTPSFVTVSPVPPPAKAATARKHGQQHRIVPQGEMQPIISSEP